MLASTCQFCERAVCLFLLGARTKDVYHRTWLVLLFLIMSVQRCVHVSSGAGGDQRHHVLLDLAVQLAMRCHIWVLGTELWLPVRLVPSLN